MNTVYLQSGIAGMLISISGSLPLGNLNVAAMQIAARERLYNAILFAAGVVLIEMVYLGITLNIIGRINIQGHVLFIFRAISVVLLLIMAAGSFMALLQKDGKNVIIDNKVQRFVLGVTMSAVNPMQIPFWMGWVFYLLSRSVINGSYESGTVFVIGAGLGTSAALLLFILVGKHFSSIMQVHKKKIDVGMGCLFTIMAILQLIKLL